MVDEVKEERVKEVRTLSGCLGGKGGEAGEK